MEPRGLELIRRYKKNYGIPAGAMITEEMILTHWELEKQLTSDLLRSTAQDRWDVFERCYTRLYAELPWLNPSIDQAVSEPPSARFGRWLDAIGPSARLVYEVGSGTGSLITHLAQSGLICTGTEITRERGSKHVTDPVPNLSWAVTDGIHLDAFETPGTYDVVLSNQVIEHFHPGDVAAHFKGVHSILKAGGRYLFSTPHRFTGPHDLSRVFKLDQPCGMHLKEYTYREMLDSARSAGFSRIHFAYIPGPLRRFLARAKMDAERFGVQYLDLQLVVEKILSAVPGHGLRRAAARILKGSYVFSDNIFLAAVKDGTPR